jgi:hypothetical protein
VRALFTVHPSVGHLHPLVPVARALSDAGHDVAVCSSASFRPAVEAFGLTHMDAGLDWLMSDQSTWDAFPPMPPPGPEFARFAVTTLADITTGRMVPDVLEIAGRWSPDLIVRRAWSTAAVWLPSTWDSPTHPSPATPTRPSTLPRSTTSRATGGWSPSRWLVIVRSSGSHPIPKT